MLKPSVQVHNQDNVLVAEFWDCLRLDPLPVQDIRKHYETHVRQGGRPEMVVDMCGVEFAGSSALGNFVSLHRLARQHGGHLIFCNVEPTVGDVFRASKLNTLFEFVADRPAAIHAILHGGLADGDGRRNRTDFLPTTSAANDMTSATDEHTGIGRFRRRNGGNDPAGS